MVGVVSIDSLMGLIFGSVHDGSFDFIC
jgi:hypothetical protein